MLPKGTCLPVFARSSTSMTFFFQVELPRDNPWAGHIISVFAATDYVDDDTLLPKLPSPLAGAKLDGFFFRDYERAFRFIVSDPGDAEPAKNYDERVAFRRLMFSDAIPDGAVEFGFAGTEPDWLLGDEAPASFDGAADHVRYLFQTRLDYEFSSIDGAPRQKTLPDRTGEPMGDSMVPEYSLFVANELYFYGIEGTKKLIYVIPQS